MHKPFTALDEEEIMVITNRNKAYFEEIKKKGSMRQDVFRYMRDVEQKKRLYAHVCKKCHYLEPVQYYAQSFTNSYCSICGCKLTFPTSNTDRTCRECAAKAGICKHCGGKMD